MLIFNSIGFLKLNEFANIFKIYQITLFAQDYSSTYKNKLHMLARNSLFFCKQKFRQEFTLNRQGMNLIEWINLKTSN